MALTCYETIQEVISSIQVGNIPYVQVIANDISSVTTVQQQLIAYAKNCVEPALHYFKQQLNSSLKAPLAAFKASHLFNPNEIKLLNPDALSVDALASFPFFHSRRNSSFKERIT